MQPLIEHSTRAAGFATRVLLDALGGAGVVLLDGVGHCAQMDATGRLAEPLLAF